MLPVSCNRPTEMSAPRWPAHFVLAAGVVAACLSTGGATAVLQPTEPRVEYDIQLTPSSVFHVASVAKQFTALAVQLLVDDDRVSWDDDIRNYVPQLTGLRLPVTLRQLAHHTSGIRDQWSLLQMAGWQFEADVVKMEDVLGLLSRQTATNFDPGEAFLYSNSGFTLLALVVERVSGQTLRTFANDQIFEPLGMTSTHFHDDHQIGFTNPVR